MICFFAPSFAARRNVLLVKDKVEAVKKLAAKDSVYAAGVAAIIAEADRQIAKPAITKVDFLGMAYMLTGDKKYADKAREVLLKESQAKSWADPEMMMRKPAWQSELNTAHKLFAVANAYDAIYETLSAKDRKTIAEGFYRLAVKPLAEDWLLPETRIHSLNSMGHNWWASCVGMCGVGALAFRDEIPETDRIIRLTDESIREWFGFEGDMLQNKPRTFDRNGGMYECINYAGYGVQEALLYMLGRRNATGHEIKGIPQLDNVADFFIQTCYPVKEGDLMSVYFGDSHKTSSGHNALMLLRALGYGSKDIDWYLSQVRQDQHREFMGLNTPVGILYDYVKDTSAAPSLPLAESFPDMGWAVVRDRWGDNATMLAVKSGLTWNHAHADAGSFILFHNGKDILGEAGRVWYKLPEYRSYYFPSEGHNVVLLNGEGQPRYQQYHSSPISGHVSDVTDTLGVRYVLADATGPNSDRFNRYFRNFLWIDDVILVIDDLSSHRPGDYQWLWHPVGEAVKKGIDINITNGESEIKLRQLYPETLCPSDFIHDYPDKMTWEVHQANGEGNQTPQPYWSFHMPKPTDRVKGVAALMLPDYNVTGAGRYAAIERRSGENWIGLRITRGETVTDVYINLLADGSLMHCNSWINPDGWNTDAYILALTYPDQAALKAGKPSRRTVIYGSSLRDPSGNTLHSTLSKVNRVW